MLYPEGITPITTKSLPPGASNPRAAAIIQQNSMNSRQANINRVGGKRRTKKYTGGASQDQVPHQVQVPQFQMQYSATGGPGTNPNDQVAAGAQLSTQVHANGVYDKYAAIMGGQKSRIKGGNPNWNWGCYSGGKSRRRNNRKSKSQRKKSRRIRRR